MSIGIPTRSVPPRRGCGADAAAAGAAVAAGAAAGAGGFVATAAAAGAVVAAGAAPLPGAVVGAVVGRAALVGCWVLAGACWPHAARSSMPAPEPKKRSAVRRLTNPSGDVLADMLTS